MSEKEKGVQSMADILKERVAPPMKGKGPPHEKAASVDEIIKIVGLNKKYGYTYWLRKVGRASYPAVMGILKQVSGADKKYNKGGLITNLLDKYNGKKKES